MTDIFGSILIADDLEEAVITTLQDWFPVYLREVAVFQGQNIPDGQLPGPRSFLTSSTVDRESADQLPSIVVVSPGLSGKPPKQEGDGSFRCPFSIGVGIFVSASDRRTTNRLVRLYTAIVRTIMIQKQAMGGFADGTTWLDESYDPDFKFTDQQTVGAGQCVFEVEVAGVVSRYGGPAVFGGPPPAPDPVHQPGSVWPEVLTVTPNVEPE